MKRLIFILTLWLLISSCEEQSPQVDNSYMLEEINRVRVANGVNKLVWSQEIACAAQTQSAWMKKTGEFEHTNPSMNLSNCGFYGTAGECIAYGQEDIETVLQAWLDSDGHRKILLNPMYNCVGCSNIGVYWTLIAGRK